MKNHRVKRVGTLKKKMLITIIHHKRNTNVKKTSFKNKNIIRKTKTAFKINNIIRKTETAKIIPTMTQTSFNNQSA